MSKVIICSKKIPSFVLKLFTKTLCKISNVQKKKKKIRLRLKTLKRYDKNNFGTYFKEKCQGNVMFDLVLG